MGRVTARRQVVTWTGDGPRTRTDALAVEEPLEIRIGGEPFAITMRTPGSDFDLALGFLLAEGVITRGDQVRTIRYCAGADASGENSYNVLDVALTGADTVALDAARRRLVTSSSCGICGKESLDRVLVATAHSPAEDTTRYAASTVLALPDRLRDRQKTFETTGGLHAAGLFTADGECLVVREDVGRHNAVDKVIGWALGNARVPGTGLALCVSGRASLELAQKATMAGIPLLVAVSAPSSLAVDLAVESGLTLAGFVRGGSMNLYSHTHRVVTG